ncbi:MAG: hypothetical protein J5787_09285 [Alphaproteobacteria bacterium]|nr:hypothetical protein [Alphaproteobacteria bacterium]
MKNQWIDCDNGSVSTSSENGESESKKIIKQRLAGKDKPLFRLAGEPGGDFFSPIFQKDKDFCDFFHFNLPKTAKFINSRINEFKTDFYQYNHVLRRL